MTYTNLGLNDQLRAINGLAGGTNGFVSSMEFDNDYEANLITTTQIKPGAVGATQIAVGAVGTAAIADLSITTGKLADAAVALSKMGTGSVGSTQFVNACIGSAAIGTAVIQNVHMGTASILNAQLGTAIINDANIGTLTANKISSGTIAANIALLGTIGFNQLYGGTATLGGTTSGNGVLNVLNNSGSAVVTLDNTGMTINNGSITVKNSDGSSVFDNYGVVSSTNFLFDTVTNDENQVISGTAETDLTDMSLNIVLPRAANVLFLYKAIIYSTQGGTGDYLGYASVRLKLGTAILDRITERGATFSSQTYVGIGQNINTTVSGHHIENIAAGTSVVKLTAIQTQDVGTPHLVIYSRTLSYLVLGK